MARFASLTKVVKLLNISGNRQVFALTRGLLTTSEYQKGKENMEDLQENPFAAKYAEKIKELQR